MAEAEPLAIEAISGQAGRHAAAIQTATLATFYISFQACITD